MAKNTHSRGRTVRWAATKENVETLQRSCKASAGPRPCISGMRKIWGKDAFIVVCGTYAYLM